MKYLAIVPARGGSKGIPGKNIAIVNGYPLIAYTLIVTGQLVDAKIIAKAVVSTDSREISDIARRYNAEVPFLRPAEISTDESKSIEFVIHALNHYEREGDMYDAVVLLQPTSPLRTAGDVTNAIALFEKYRMNSLVSVYQNPQINVMAMYKMDGDIGIPCDPNHNMGIRRQDYYPTMIRNGAIYITRTDYLREHGRIISNTPILFEMPYERSLNIDYPEDLVTAEISLRSSFNNV